MTDGAIDLNLKFDGAIDLNPKTKKAP